MIIDRIEEQRRYYKLHSEMEQAFAFVSEATDLEPGRYDLDNGLYANVSLKTTNPMDEIRFEAHKKYIDLQCLISGGERISWANINEMNPCGDDEKRDIYYYNGTATSLRVRAGYFYIMFPGDAHKTGVHREFEKQFKKVSIKIPVEE